MHRFDVAGREQTLHIFDWQQDRVSFRSIDGHDPSTADPGQIIGEWEYLGADNPPPGKENVRFNLWLNHGEAPSDGETQEVIIKKFEFVPTSTSEKSASGPSPASPPSLL